MNELWCLLSLFVLFNSDILSATDMDLVGSDQSHCESEEDDDDDDDDDDGDYENEEGSYDSDVERSLKKKNIETPSADSQHKTKTVRLCFDSPPTAQQIKQALAEEGCAPVKNQRLIVDEKEVTGHKKVGHNNKNVEAFVVITPGS